MAIFTWTGTAAMLNGDLNYGLGNWIAIPAGIKITKVSINVKRTGSPAGNMHLYIARQAQNNGAYSATFGSVLCTDIPTSNTWVEFSGSYTTPATEEYTVYAFFDGNHTFASDYIAVNQQNGCDQSNGAKATCLLWNQPFSDSAVGAYAVAMIVEGVPVGNAIFIF